MTGKPNFYARENRPKQVKQTDGQPTESAIQQAIVSWSALQEYKGRPLAYYLFHVPNGGRRSAREGNKLKKEGVQGGIPDLYMDIPKGVYHGFRLELKRNTGGIVSKEQKERIGVLQEEGYYAIVCRGYEASIEAIEKYMALEDGQSID